MDIQELEISEHDMQEDAYLDEIGEDGAISQQNIGTTCENKYNAFYDTAQTNNSEVIEIKQNQQLILNNDAPLIEQAYDPHMKYSDPLFYKYNHRQNLMYMGLLDHLRNDKHEQKLGKYRVRRMFYSNQITYYAVIHEETLTLICTAYSLSNRIYISIQINFKDYDILSGNYDRQYLEFDKDMIVMYLERNVSRDNFILYTNYKFYVNYYVNNQLTQKPYYLKFEECQISRYLDTISKVQRYIILKPNFNFNKAMFPVSTYRKNGSLSSALQNYQTLNFNKNLVQYYSMQPHYDEKQKTYYFSSSRIKQSSVKNFQFMYEGNMVLNFGKLGTNDFVMDFQYPFSIAISFALSLSSFYY